VTTGTPSASSYRIGLQGINASGNPDGTWLTGGTAYVDFTPPAAASADDGKWLWKTLAASASVTVGDRIAVVLERTAATDASNKITAVSQFGNGAMRVAFPVSQTHNGTAWTKISSNGPLMGIASSTTCWGFPLEVTSTSNAFGNTAEVGMLFTIPTNFCSTFKLASVNAAIRTDPSGGARDIYATLYSTPTGTPTIVAQTAALDVDIESNAASDNRLFEFVFTTQPTLNAGTEYAIGISTTTATNSNIYTWATNAVGDWDAWSGGQQFSYATRTLTSFPPDTDTGSFTATTTKRPFIDLVFADLTAPTGGGGMRLAGHGGLAA